ncbi:MAG: hypothetical protein MUE97_01725 [Phycisphaerales bacterium]|jgi:hemolysin activation/secretion protein|nr:hypothetical protein [Phycisphaerales bacterium]
MHTLLSSVEVFGGARVRLAAAVMLLAGTTGAFASSQPGDKLNLQDLNVPIQAQRVETVRATEEAQAAAPVSPIDRSARRTFPITSFELRYAEASKGIPRLPQLPDVVAKSVAKLGRLADGTFVARRDGGEPIDLRVGDFLAPSAVNFDAGPTADLSDGGAIAAVTSAIAEEFKRRGFIGVFVTPIVGGPDGSGASFDGEVSDTLTDIRQPAGRTSLRLEVFVAPVGEVRSLAAGDRVPNDQRLNSPVHEAIRRGSPVKAGAFIDKNKLDEYTIFKGRHPGRRVDVGVGPGTAQGDLTLDYLVTEAKPWQFILQASNTGTRQTDTWRYRLGFQHTQLTGRDDILRVDYLTAGFNDAHAVVVSYDFPLWSDRLRLRPYVNYSRYTAGDVGSGQDFRGEAWTAGAELAWNFWQKREWFLDAIAGARYENIRTKNTTLGSSGQAGFFIPGVGVRLERYNEKWSTNAQAMVEFNASDWGNTPNSAGLAPLGRFAADDDFQTFRASVDQSFFIEPLFFSDAFSGKGLAPGQNWQPGMTLAHEIFVSGKFFTSMDQRLIPNFQEVQGGFFTVRGYPENFVAGDRSYAFTGEYRLHLSRLLGIDPEPATAFGKPFRYRPQEAFGYQDWGLILRGFLDAARVEQSERLPFEEDETLVGAGIGAEVQLYRNINARLDVGFPLKDVEANGRTIGSGDVRLHFIITALF